MTDHDRDHPAPEYLFDLPRELIAQSPLAKRTSSRMLLVQAESGVQGEEEFSALPDLLTAGDLLVLNDSRVLPARLYTMREDTGGRVELLLIEPQTDTLTWLAMARPARRLRTGTRLEILSAPDRDGSASPEKEFLTVAENLGGGEVLVTGITEPGELALKWGVMPLPPYIQRDFQDQDDLEKARSDRQRYQTVYATNDPDGSGSVAAPTAGLHFDEGILDSLADRGVSVAHVRLHVGPGTFRPPDAEQIQRRRLHAERFIFPASLGKRMAETRAGGGRIIAVGTTSLRVLETVARLDLDEALGEDIEFGHEGVKDPFFTGRARRSGDGWEVAGITRLFLMPPDTVSAADGLLTNFHLPGSSLLMLIASFLGPGIWPRVYAEAIERKLRFYSYGDCMLALKSGRNQVDA